MDAERSPSNGIYREAVQAFDANRDGPSGSILSVDESESVEPQRRRSDSRREDVGARYRVVGDTRRALCSPPAKRTYV